MELRTNLHNSSFEIAAVALPAARRTLPIRTTVYTCDTTAATVEHNLLLLLLGACRDVLGVNPTTTTRSGSYADSVIKGWVKQLNAAVNGLVPAYQQLSAARGSTASQGT
jgi:hypothetical protein